MSDGLTIDPLLKLHEGKGWETSSYKKYYTNVRDRFAKETADYLVFMQERHKIATMDYIATLEQDNKMKQNRIEHLEKKLKHSEYSNDK